MRLRQRRLIWRIDGIQRWGRHRGFQKWPKSKLIQWPESRKFTLTASQPRKSLKARKTQMWTSLNRIYTRKTYLRQWRCCVWSQLTWVLWKWRLWWGWGCFEQTNQTWIDKIQIWSIMEALSNPKQSLILTKKLEAYEEMKYVEGITSPTLKASFWWGEVVIDVVEDFWWHAGKNTYFGTHSWLFSEDIG